ncbi:MAG TPA: hypothetical protein VLM39_02730, partial [Ignavibacteriaceae bacterium]|nr:hypothetical protein [Ignavibacteriaceae bacterium]
PGSSSIIFFVLSISALNIPIPFTSLSLETGQTIVSSPSAQENHHAVIPCCGNHLHHEFIGKSQVLFSFLL